MNIEKIKRTLTRLYRLFFTLACIALTATMYLALRVEVDGGQYPFAGIMNFIVGLIFIAAVCRVTRDLIPEPKNTGTKNF
jgi:hypothetical protein